MNENEKKILVLLLLLRITKLGSDCRMEEYLKNELKIEDVPFDDAKNSLVISGYILYQCHQKGSCCPLSLTVDGAEKAREILMKQLFCGTEKK